MDPIQFAYPERAVWLIAVLAVELFFIWKVMSRGRALGKFVSEQMQERLVTRPSAVEHLAQCICLGVAGIAFVVALMQPQIVRQEKVALSKEAANIYVALDVSKSMLATDAVPSRLERAKSEILDMLPSFTTHRVGLLAFAGRPTVLSPLTMDHGFFRLVLDSASPSSVTLGGTNIGDVIRKGTSLLSEQEGPKVMVLISDGEDHDSYPEEAANAARQAGIVIITVGFGSEQGAPIDVLDPATGRKKRVTDSNGNEVISKLDGELLRKIALVTEGVYVPAATGVLDLESIMKKHILPLVEDNAQVRTVENRIDLFQYFIGFGLFFLIGFMLLEGPTFRARQLREKNA